MLCRPKFEGVKTWVMQAEHLVAIALRIGRAKDHARILQFLEQNAVNRNKLNQILSRYDLTPKWQRFESRYVRETNE